MKRLLRFARVAGTPAHENQSLPPRRVFSVAVAGIIAALAAYSISQCVLEAVVRPANFSNIPAFGAACENAVTFLLACALWQRLSGDSVTRGDSKATIQTEEGSEEEQQPTLAARRGGSVLLEQIA